MRWRSVGRWLSVLPVALMGVVSWPASGGASPQGADEPRVLVLSLPTVGWGDLYQGDTPTLDALLDQSAVASLTVRVVGPLTDAADGYATVSAGTRASGVVGSGQVLEPEEDFFGTPAGAAFRRNTGLDPGEGMVSLASPNLTSSAARRGYDAEVGTLGQALEDAGIPRAVIANADASTPRGEATFDRQAGMSLVDLDGLVPAGAVSGALLAPDPEAPFGRAFDPDAVVAAFDEVWPAGGVVLVEASDLVRADRYRRWASPAQETAQRRDALARTDALVATLLARVDLERDSVLVIGPYHRQGDVHLTVAGLHAPGVEPGLLRSGSTRRAGFVTLVDVAPTILDLVGVDRPSAMEGRRFERAAGAPQPGAAVTADLAAVNEAALYRDRMVGPVAGVFVVLQAVLWVAAALAITRGGRRAREAVALGALLLLVYLPATYLAGLVAFQEVAAVAYWAFVLGIAALGALLAVAIGRRWPLDPLLLALGAVFGLLVVDMLLGAPLQLNTVFGYSPTVGGRFAGMGNLAYGQFAGAAFLLCGLLSRRLAGRSWATAAAFGVLVLAILIDGAPIWGADVGGVLAFVPAVGVTAAQVLGHRIQWRSVALWGSATLVAVGTFAAIDLARPADERTHLGRLVEAIGDQGVESFTTVVGRKLGANLGVITSSLWTAMVPIVFGFIVYLLWRAPGHLRTIRDTIPESLAGLAVVGFLGFVLNDSGIVVPGVMLGVVNATLVYLTVRTVTLSPPAEP